MLAIQNESNLVLNNLEYLALKMRANPGQSGRWYLRELYRYRFGKLTSAAGSFGARYFVPTGKYRNVLWVDDAPKTSTAHDWSGPKPRPARSSWRLTPAGEEYASRAFKKISREVVDDKYDI